MLHRLLRLLYRLKRDCGINRILQKPPAERHKAVVPLFFNLKFFFMKIRFGMIVTDGRGKAGGQYVRKFGNGHVLQNITVPTKRQGNFSNTQRLLNAWVFSLWAGLADSSKTAWNTVASNLTAYNVFGDARAVSGREAFNRLNMIVFPWSGVQASPLDFNYEIPNNTATAFATNVNLSEFSVFTSAVPAFEFFEIRAKRLKFLGQKVDVKALKIFHRGDDLDAVSTMFANFSSAYPDLEIGQFYSVAIRFMNSSGLPSPFFQYPMIVD